jgi:hypothetical protein
MCGLSNEWCGLRVWYHNHYAPRTPIFDVLADCFYGPARESRCRCVLIESRLLVAHLVASVSAFAWYTAAFLAVAPRLALLQLLAVGFMFSSYFEGCCSLTVLSIEYNPV